MGQISKDEMKEATKAAIKEWLDEKAMAFGYWSIRLIACAALCALVYWILRTNGWSIVKTEPLELGGIHP